MSTVRNEESIFTEALEKASPFARAAFLTAACGEDTVLRERIEKLLRSHETAESFLRELPAPFVPAAVSGPIIERAGTVIGPYKLLQQIGEGGMGTVFMAEQTHPVQRKVALKIIKPGMDSRQVVARFEAERQALAMMDHQNIARVLDVGTTVNGRPYFVMELVHGVPITDFCDSHKLTPRERMELFVPVCQAIQHAHQKGIIHRDVKPTNVLVTLYDDKPVPKVIDFGVAKALEQRLTEKTMFTQFGAMVGTFEYMSPEQAEMNALGVDTRSDIYSLGVLLYELLTGTTPLEQRRLGEAALNEMVRLIKEEEAPRPSVRLSTSNNLPKIAAARNTDPARLSSLIRGEIDWIVMKCLEKDRARRYETSNGLAMDVERHLADEPVTACPPSATYRLRKLVRRNKGPVLAGSLVSLALVAGIVGTTWGLIREGQQRLVVEGQRNELAERNRALEAAHDHERLLNERARQAIETVSSDMAIEQLTRQKKLRPEQEDFLGKMIQYWAESAEEGAATKQERSRQASAYRQIGRMSQILGRWQDGEKAHRRAAELFQHLAAEFPDQPEFRLELAESHNNLGSIYRATDRPKDAEAAYADALPILKQLSADFPSRPEFRQVLAGIHNNLGGLFQETGRVAEAEAAQAEALAIRKQLAADFPGRPIIRRALAMSHNNLGWLYQSTNRLEKAVSAFDEAVVAQKQAVADFPNRPEFRLELAKYLSNLGNLLSGTGRSNEAKAVQAEARAIFQQLIADYPNRPEFRQEMAERGLQPDGRETGGDDEESLTSEALGESDSPKK